MPIEPSTTAVAAMTIMPSRPMWTMKDWPTLRAARE